MHSKGRSVSEIAKVLKCDRKTVYHYIDQDDFSPTPPVTQNRPSMLDPYRDIIAAWLSEDAKGFGKQHHTYQRIKERLLEEHDFDCKYSTVADFIRRYDLKTTARPKASLDLSWEAGSAQADFGQADCIYQDQVVRMHYLVLSLPYSNVGYAQIFFGESGECFCQGLVDIFGHLGGVPPLIVFDNATGIGQRRGGRFIETELFSRLRAHYRFEARFCNPAAGWEKGNVERKVALLRNELFVPAPVISDIDVYNSQLLKRCAFQEDRLHYSRKVRQGDLLDADSSALRTLPAKRFSAVRYETIVANGYGHVTIDDGHIYSSVPEAAGDKVIVAIGAHTVTITDIAGEHLASHQRAFGKSHIKTIDTISQLGLLTHRPKGFRNSVIRDSLPASVVSYLDGLDTEGLRRDLRLLHDTARRSGLEATLGALDVLAVEHESFPDFFQVGVLAARIADLGLDAPPEPGADLSCYDALFLGGGEHGC
jgi:transposase